MEHGVNANLLRKWVVLQTGTRPPRRRALVPSLPQAPLLAVRTEGARVISAATSTEGYLELVIAGGTIRVHGRVDAQTLSIALDCLARRA
jgi:transposase-like protein